VAFGPGLAPRYDPGFGVVPVNIVGADQKFSVQSFDIFGNTQDGLSTAAEWNFTCVGGDPSPVTSFLYNDLVGNATYTATYNVRRWYFSLVSRYFALLHEICSLTFFCSFALIDSCR
jgi:hypothetical protein